jgi:signal transduction histidine kinase
MSSLNLIFYNLSGNVKVFLEKKLVTSLALVILLIGLLVYLFFQNQAPGGLREKYIFLGVAIISILVLIRIFFVLKRDLIVEFGKTNVQLENEISEHKQVEQQLRHLSARLQSVREEERKGIAREIHDELGQQLTGIKMDLSWLYKKINYEQPDELQEKVKILIALTDTTIKTVRKIATELRPGLLDDLGLIAAIEWQCSEFEKRTGIRCVFSTRLDDADFGTTISTEVFRIVQETLTNVLRHANATHVEIKMTLLEDDLHVEITDNGQGISLEEIRNTKSLGLLGMGERAKILNGTFSITGAPGNGTTVRLHIPVPGNNSLI